MIRRYPSVFLLPFVVGGIALADCSRLPSELFLFLMLVFCVAGLVTVGRRRGVAVVTLALSLMSFAAFHFSIKQYDMGPGHLERVLEDGKVYHIFGQVTGWPEFKTSGTEIKVQLDSLSSDVTRSVQGAIILKVSDSTTALQTGDRIEFHGRLYSVKGNRQPGGFDYRRFMNLKGVFGFAYLSTLHNVRVESGNRSALFSVVGHLRTAIVASFYRNLSPTAAALASGFLIGETRDIQPEVYRWFRDSGTLHLLAVSGSNVALVIFFFIVVLHPFPISRRIRSAILLISVFIFALLSYGEPSVIRASIMAALVIVAGLFERRYDLNNLIAFTAMIILLWDPAQLLNVGFQLSFVTAWGLIFILPRLFGDSKWYRGRGWYRWLGFSLIVSVVAQVCSSPLIVFYFHRLPVISPLANLIIIPLTSLAVVGSLVLLVADLILPVLGIFAGSLLNYLMKAIVFFLEGFGSEGIPVLEVGYLSPVMVIMIYTFILLGVFSLSNRIVRRVTVIALLVIVNSILGVTVAGAVHTSEQMELNLFSIPGGLAVVVHSQDSNTADLLITGATDREYAIDERVIAPALGTLGIDRINTIIVQWAEYGAVDDLLRLANNYRAGTFRVATEMTSGFREVNKLQGVLADSVNVTGYGRSIHPDTESCPGYYATP
ncbi:MAG: ComEC/Rec2 family competence protein, partial [candidate division Zixibacteria bacterium]|nr:ComEC/Rec2 family competence protein [candidate division Zixibacteria bacterium]